MKDIAERLRGWRDLPELDRPHTYAEAAREIDRLREVIGFFVEALDAIPFDSRWTNRMMHAQRVGRFTLANVSKSETGSVGS